MRKIAATAALALALVTLTAAPASAQRGSYGDAGCGLGSMIFGSTPGIVQVLAATTNGFLFSQTFGITFGTSNCGSNVVSQVGARNFIQTNRQALAKDIAKGDGETLANLSSLAGCSDPAAVGQRLQANYATIFPTAQTSDVEVSDRIVDLLGQDATLACDNLI